MFPTQPSFLTDSLCSRSLAEAEAYCRFRGSGARIMREREYELLLSPDVAGRCGKHCHEPRNLCASNFSAPAAAAAAGI